MIIKTIDNILIKKIFNKFSLPKTKSHKGQNGKILIIGGSTLFHAAPLWAAEVASNFTDMVHFASTYENNEIFLSVKKKFRNGIVVSQKNLLDYVKEDDVVLLGTGMVRDGDEAEYTKRLTKQLIVDYPQKRFVFDAGALQTMNKELLLTLKEPPVLTPHQKEFSKLFGINIIDFSQEKKEEMVLDMAKKYKSTILLKAVDDIISDGQKVYIVKGGNAGLTKGGTGDILASLVASFYCKNQSLDSAIFASTLLKKTAEVLHKSKGYWYNVSDIINKLPEVLKDIVL